MSNRWGYSNEPHSPTEPLAGSNSIPSSISLQHSTFGLGHNHLPYPNPTVPPGSGSLALPPISVPPARFINSISSSAGITTNTTAVPPIMGSGSSITGGSVYPQSGSIGTGCGLSGDIVAYKHGQQHRQHPLPQTTSPDAARKYQILDSNNRSLPYPTKEINLLPPPNSLPTPNSPIPSNDGQLLIGETKRLCQFLPVMDWDKIYATFQAWNRVDLSPPDGNCEFISMLVILSIGYRVTPHDKLLNPIFFQQWVDNLIAESSKALYYQYPPSFYHMNDITAYLLHASYLCYNDSDHIGISWTKMAMLTASIQRLGYRFNVNEQNMSDDLWLRYFKITEKLVACSMRTPSLLSPALFPHISETSLTDATFSCARLTLYEAIDSVLNEIYSARYLVLPSIFSRYEAIARRVGEEFAATFTPAQVTEPSVRYQLLTIQALCNTIVMLVYRPYMITIPGPPVEVEIFRRKGTAAAIGAIETMLLFLESDKTTRKIYKWFSWVDILMGAFEACVVLMLDHNNRQKHNIKADQNNLIQRFAVRLVPWPTPQEGAVSIMNSRYSSTKDGQYSSPDSSNSHSDSDGDDTSRSTPSDTCCWSTTDLNWRVNLVDRCRIHFIRLSTGELSRPAKAATILTAMLGNLKVAQVPRPFGPFNKVIESSSSSSRYVTAQYDESFFESVGSEPSIEFNQRIGRAINDTMSR